MKKLSALFAVALIVLAGTLSSCKKIEDKLRDAMDVTIHTEIETPFTVVPDAVRSTRAGSSNFSSNSIIDISENDDLEDYLDNIQSLEVTKIKVMITSTTPSGLALVSSNFSIIDNVNGDSFSFATPANMPIIDGSQFEIGSDAPGWDIINRIIASMHASTLNVTGTINNDTFEVGFVHIIDVKVVANP